jgi:hypothetical protein
MASSIYVEVGVPVMVTVRACCSTSTGRSYLDASENRMLTFLRYYCLRAHSAGHGYACHINHVHSICIASANINGRSSSYSPQTSLHTLTG